MPSKKLKNIVVEIRQGDITDCEADILVNAANTSLVMGAGVAGAMKIKGGAIIEKEALAKGPIKVGWAVETSAGNMKARFVIHAAVMGTDFKTSAQYIALAQWNSFALAEKLAMETIAFPALGTGVGAFPIATCAQMMFEMTSKFDLAGPKHIKRVIFVLYTKKAYEEFEKEYRRI